MGSRVLPTHKNIGKDMVILVCPVVGVAKMSICNRREANKERNISKEIVLQDKMLKLVAIRIITLLEIRTSGDRKTATVVGA